MNIQMILALGAMVLLSMVIINTNKTSLYTKDVMYDSSFGILANSLASSVIEEASHKHFDEFSIEQNLSSTSDLTAIASLGVEGGENANDPSTFDDFDDFDDYDRIEDKLPSAIFHITADVCYVNSATPDIPNTSTRTWHKKITVKVTSNSMKDTISQSSIFSYWTFR